MPYRVARRKARLQQVTGQLAALELEEDIQAEGEQLGAQAVDFILKFGWEYTRDIGAGKYGHLGGEAAGFEGLVLEAEAVGDQLGAEELVAALDWTNRAGRDRVGLGAGHQAPSLSRLPQGLRPFAMTFLGAGAPEGTPLRGDGLARPLRRPVNDGVTRKAPASGEAGAFPLFTD